MRGVSKNIVNLKRYVPDFISALSEMKASYESQEIELQLLKEQIQDIKNQFQINTATWGLRLYEDKYGLTYNPSLSYEERREILKAARRGRGVINTEKIKLIAEAFSGGECNVIRHDKESYFTIQFVGVKGIPRNMQGLINELKKDKPSHLGFDFKYTYTNWNYLDSKNLSFDNAETL